jgi:hypothetical protein
MYKLLARLAVEKGGVVDVKELGASASGATNLDVAVRKLRAKLPARIAQCFEEAGVVLPAGLAEEVVVAVGRGAYRIGVGCKVL